MVKLDEDTIVTGSSDGMLRVVSLQPNKLVGVLGEHAGGWGEWLGHAGAGSRRGSRLWDPFKEQGVLTFLL